MANSIPPYASDAALNGNNAQSVTVESPPSVANSPTQVLPTSTSNSSALNPRSCVTCRKRKVRCDKRYPCLNCTKAGIECHFPGPGRAPRKARKPPDNELLSRLRRLESVVQNFGVNVEDDRTTTQKQVHESRPPAVTQTPSDKDYYDADPKKMVPKAVDKDFGRLVIGDGRSRYVTNSFWMSLGDEVAEMQYILDEPSSEEDEDQSPDHSGSGSSPSHQGFIFGFSSTSVNLRALHPTPSQVFILWEVFKENVDPLIRIIHRPSLKGIVFQASNNPESINKHTEAMLFSIYYAAATSLTESQCQKLLGEDRDRALQKYRFAMEQALARANLLSSSNFMLLQAFVLFLICVRRQDDTRLVWTLTGIAIRNALSLGLHRDGEQFNLPPFEVEMRRRLWWMIITLDTRSSEDHGADYAIFETQYDTKIPLNLNDEDISPDDKEAPKERLGCTEMTFNLIRFEVGVTMRRLASSSLGEVRGEGSNAKSLDEKEKLIETCHQRIEERYLQYCDMNVPIFWVTATVGRLIMAKMWLIVHHPFQRDSRPISSDIRDRLFLTSVEVIEFSRLLEVNESTAKWGWHFRTYMQWHAVAFVLAELCVRNLSPQVDRAWRAVDSVYGVWESSISKGKKGMLWRPMQKLMARAQQTRQRQLREKDVLSWSTPNGSAQQTSSETPRGPPASPYPITAGALGAAAEAMGLDLEDNAMTIDQRQAVPGTEFGVSEPPNITPAQRNLTDADINQWLGQGDFEMLQPDGQFSNWDNWQQVVREFNTDVQQGDQQIPPVGELSDWF
ncbi:MAG: hypothetical protein Q9227_000028 [Pyrenula ochraceoflavens]